MDQRMSLFSINPLLYSFEDGDKDKVDSSNIDKIKYCSHTYTLIVKFSSGGVYLYSSVPHSVGHKLLRAESKGKYLSKYIVRNYPFVKLDQ
jgi:hypothetical protein